MTTSESGLYPANPATVTAQSSEGAISMELSARRTGMSFQRTRMSAERTLMSVIRTSLSLIGFGFTINQFFQKLYTSKVLDSSHGERHFGTGLLVIGCLLLIGGIAYHLVFMSGLRKTRDQMREQGLIHGESVYPVSLTLLAALALLVLGGIGAIGILFRIGPFQ